MDIGRFTKISDTEWRIDPEGAIKTVYGITGVPESFIIDRQGILVKKIIGPVDWATPEIFRFFGKLIQKP